MNTPKAANIDEYISWFPEEVQKVLEQVRSGIKQTAPQAEEGISYAMPAFSLDSRPLVYFAAFKNHIGFYALPSGNEAFQEELAEYKVGKGSIQFPLDKPIPLKLIQKIVEFRVKENLEIAKNKIKKTPKL